MPHRVILDSTGDHAASSFADKYYIAADNSPGSPFNGRVYVAWVEYDVNRKDRVRLSFSTDDGLTWSVPAYLTASGDYQSPIPVIGIGGEVYIAYENIDPAFREVRLAASTDGGNTFSFDKKISNYSELGPLYPPGDVSAHPVIKDHLRVNSFPSIAIDHSAAHHGRIYMTWAAMGIDNRHHIYLTQSDDAGSSWTLLKSIENDLSPVNTDKFFPWIAVDDSNGDVGVAYYDSRSDTANVLTDLYMLFSNDGGGSFTIERISGASSDVTASSSGLTGFFGDYNGLAAHKRTWFPAWTDSRVGYDQDIYTSMVRPYAPSAPVNFIALEDSSTHLPDLRWGYSGNTTFGMPLGNYVFRLRRSDGGLQIDLPKNTLSYNDSLAIKNTDYTYTVQVIASDQDSSLTDTAHFSPRANNQPLPPLLTFAKAMTSGLQITFRVPDKNAAGTALKNLNKIYYLVNGIVTDSFAVDDNSLGHVKTFIFSHFQNDGYYLIQLASSTKNNEGDTILSVLSAPAWLYAGTPLASYSEDFSLSKNIFTLFAWDTTRAGGKLPGNFINDSLPDVNYQKGINSWFLLPSVAISADAQSLEFIHIALVAPGDSAIVEVSTDDGLSFSPYTFYDKTTHPLDWGNSLSDSKPVHEIIGLRYLSGQDAIIRFRLHTQSSGGDGWFLDSIQFTNFLSVSSPKPISAFRAGLAANPIRIGSPATIKLFSDKPVSLTVNLYSLLGEKTTMLINNTPMFAGDYELGFSPDKAGCYFYEVIARSANGEERVYGKYVVIP